MRNETSGSSAPQDAGENTVSGVVDNIVYRAEDTGYTVCSVKVPGSNDNITVVGNCAAIWIGETVQATGKWTRHRHHGHQFQAEAIVCHAPTSTKGIEKYLASGVIRGIGPELAKRLVAMFGRDTLQIIDKESKRLQEVEGIGPKRRQMIKESWTEQQAVRDIMIFLQSHGVGTAQSNRIYRQYGSEAISVISRNPYCLCRDVWGIGFKTADGVAMSIGIPPHSEARARAGLVHILQTMTEEGHCFSPADILLEQAGVLLDIPQPILAQALEHEVRTGALVREMDRIYPALLHQAENEISIKLNKMRSTQHPFKPILTDKALEWAEVKMRIQFAPTQAEALRMALSEKISIITGGPGVGKTTIIRALVDVFSARKLMVCLAAPTGRAAKRMEEATGQPAKTLHRLLKYIPNLGHFDHDADNPLKGDVFILDEVSMIDIPLMQAFLAALPDSSCLILVGDVDQLPSVGPGNVLRDLIASNVFPCRKLETIFRQESGGWIVQNAHRINRGEPLELPEGEEDSDFYFIETQEPDEVIRRMLELVTRRMPEKFRLDPMTDIQVLTPMRRNQLGAENLNAVLQEALNPSGAEIIRFGRKYRLGDRVMQIRNNYDKEIFNGDIGWINEVNTEAQRIAVRFDDRQLFYEIGELDELVHAYACSIHKAQGSEYPAVVVLLTTQHYKLLQRNLLYTALTRGRNLVCLVGSSKAVHIAIRNNEILLRRTSLCERLARLANKDAADRSA